MNVFDTDANAKAGPGRHRLAGRDVGTPGGAEPAPAVVPQDRDRDAGDPHLRAEPVEARLEARRPGRRQMAPAVGDAGADDAGGLAVGDGLGRRRASVAGALAVGAAVGAAGVVAAGLGTGEAAMDGDGAGMLAAATSPPEAPPRTPPIAIAPASTATTRTPTTAGVRTAPARRVPVPDAGRAGRCSLGVVRHDGETIRCDGPKASPDADPRPLPHAARAPEAPMPDDRSAATLLREVGLMADGPVQWGRPSATARRACS